MPANNSKEQSLLFTLCSSNTTDQKSHKVLVLFVCVALQRHLHLPDRSSAHGHFSSSNFFYGAVSQLELMLALGTAGTSMPKQQHTSDRPFCRPRYGMVGHVAFSSGFCPLTNCYICLCILFLSILGFPAYRFLIPRCMQKTSFLACEVLWLCHSLSIIFFYRVRLTTLSWRTKFWKNRVSFARF